MKRLIGNSASWLGLTLTKALSSLSSLLANLTLLKHHNGLSNRLPTHNPSKFTADFDALLMLKLCLQSATNSRGAVHTKCLAQDCYH